MTDRAEYAVIGGAPVERLSVRRIFDHPTERLKEIFAGVDAPSEA